MIEILKHSLRVSRFRFWIYTAGTYVVGYSLGSPGFESFFRPEYLLYLIYFFFPANLLIYGVNDYWDGRTDEHNPKKGTKEEKLTDRKKKRLAGMLVITLCISLILILFQDNVSRILFSVFLLLSYFYSAKPIRFKSIPVLDFSSNMLYIMPGIFGFYIASGSLPGFLLVLGGYFHISAMHIFSAIPDMEYDRKAKIRTTVTVIGKKLSLFLCVMFWSLLSYLAISLSGFHPLSFLVLIYPFVPLALLLKNNLEIEKVYWFFPYINTLLGGLLTFMILLQMF